MKQAITGNLSNLILVVRTSEHPCPNTTAADADFAPR
jgi:hypothetical protein